MSGTEFGRTLGTPIGLMVRNKDQVDPPRLHFEFMSGSMPKLATFHVRTLCQANPEALARPKYLQQNALMC